MAERSRERRVFGLLGADHSHGRVAESADVQNLFERGVSGSLSPKPAPALLLERLAKLGQHGEVAIPALALTILENYKKSYKLGSIFEYSFLLKILSILRFKNYSL